MLEVLLHTVIDWMRTEEGEGEGDQPPRQIHHRWVETRHGHCAACGSGIETYFYSVSTSLQQPGPSNQMRRPFTGRSSRNDFANMTQVKDSRFISVQLKLHLGGRGEEGGCCEGVLQKCFGRLHHCSEAPVFW